MALEGAKSFSWAADNFHRTTVVPLEILCNIAGKTALDLNGVESVSGAVYVLNCPRSVRRLEELCVRLAGDSS